MTVTTLVIVPGVYQELLDDVAGTKTTQWKIGGSWVTTAIDYGFSPNAGLDYSVGGCKVPYSFAALATDYTTASVSLVYTGLTASITLTDTAVELIGTLTVQNSTVNDGVSVSLVRTVANGALPSIGAAKGGSDTVVWAGNSLHAIAACNMGLGFDFVDPGLTAGAVYQYYVTMAAVTAGTAKLVGTATLPNASTLELQNI